MIAELRAARSSLGHWRLLSAFIGLLALAIASLPVRAGETRADEELTVPVSASSATTLAEAGKDEPAPGWDEILEFVVIGSPIVWPGHARLTLEELTQEPNVNLGEALVRLPGVSAVRTGPNATELVIRGMGGERVRTQMGVVPVLGASPAVMDPPLSYVSPYALRAVTVTTGLGSVADGPGGVGGRIVIAPDYRRPSNAEPEVHGFLGTTLDSARSGFRTDVGAFGGTDWADARATAGTQRLWGYHSGDGTSVPGSLNEVSTALSLGFKPMEGHRFWHALNYVRQDDSKYPGLPMNKEASDTWLYAGGYGVSSPGEWVERIELEGGLSQVDLLHTNKWKPTRSLVHAEARAHATVYAGVLRFRLRASDEIVVNSGVSFEHLAKDAVRTQKLVAIDSTIPRDYVWPDASQSDLGAFVEASFDLPYKLRLSLGGRGDAVASAAAAVDTIGFNTQTIRDHYVTYYGQAAAAVNRTEGTGAGNLVLKWSPVDTLTVHLGGGLATRVATITERYFAFAPLPGGYRLGNPSLASEKVAQLDLGLQGEVASWLRGSVSGFFFHIADYILQAEVGMRDVDGDGSDDAIGGYRNVDAQLVGLEASIDLLPLSCLHIPLSVAWVRGQNRTDRRPLPLIPPLEGAAALRLELGEAFLWWLQVGGRFVAPQRRVDRGFPEDRTDGFVTLNARAGVLLWDRARVQVGAENLLDAEYHEHLTRETVVPVGGLRLGDEVPAPGRSLFVSLYGEY